MLCPSCGANNPDGSQFCNSCGRPARAASATAPANPDPRAAASGPPANVEIDLWTGRPSPAAYLSHFLLLGLWWAAIGTLSVVVWPGREGVARWWWVPVAAAGLPALYLAAAIGADALSHSYRLTSQRLFESVGILIRQTRELELIRVKDTTVTQGLLERLSGAGQVAVYSTDSTDPVLHLDRIKDPHGVKERIRTAVQQRRGGTMYVEKV
ncbi:MAG: PH domain-containing protein [Planctomycetes bacterium]|nr:PH domain-containing protein [Planctomycetota bacterium]